METLKLSNSPKLPHDPSQIQTMADYDLSLCLYHNWFEYDLARKALPGLIASWKFEKTQGAYEFIIDPKAKWSDGSNLTSEHLILNLKKLIKSKTSYGNSIDAIIDVTKIKSLSDTQFIIPIKNKKPSTAFFQRMGSSFLALTHPSDWDAKGNVIKNSLVIGPYKIKTANESLLSLEANEFDFLSSKKRVKNIQISRGQKATSLDDFLDGKSTDDIVQTYTLMPIETYTRILDSKLPFWTRAFDRVSYMAPIKSNKDAKNLREYLKALGELVHKEKNRLAIPSVVKVASSLQPKGYPLFKKINYAFDKKKTKNIPKEISILAIDNYQLKIQKPILEDLTAKISPDIKINWIIKKNVGDFIKEIGSDSAYDIKLLSFGVADPEAATWLSLVMNENRPFVEIVKADITKFSAILKQHQGLEKEVVDLKTMISEIGERGSYLPLFHFSTMSIGKKGMSFENISELDETVNYSKLLIK